METSEHYLQIVGVELLDRVVEPVAEHLYLVEEVNLCLVGFEFGGALPGLEYGPFRDECEVVTDQRIVCNAEEQRRDCLLKLPSSDRFDEVVVEPHLQDV